MFGVVIISAFVAVWPVHAVTLPEAAKVVPAETAFLIEVDNFSQLEGQFKKTNLYKLYKDPAMTAFVEHLEEKWNEKLAEQDDELIKTLLAADVRPTGRVAVAIMTGDYVNKGEDFGVVFIVQWGQGIDKVKEMIDKTVQKAIEQGARRTAEDYRSVKIISIIKERPEPSGAQPGAGEAALKTVQRAPLTVSYCFVGDSLIGAGDVDIEALKFVLAHIQGASGNTLADDSDYVGTTKSLAAGRDIKLYVNIKQLIKTAIAEDSSGETATMLANLGLDNVNGLAFSVGFARQPGTFLSGSGLLKVVGEKKGILKILEPVLARINPPRFIGASAYSVSFLHLDIRAAYDELFKMLNAINPMLAAPLTVPLPAGSEGEGGLELKKDVINYFGPEIIIAESIEKGPEQGDETPTSTIVSVAVTDRKALEKSLSTLHSSLIAPSEPEARRELLGHTIYTITAPSFSLPGTGRTPLQQATEGIEMPKMAFTVTDTHLVISSESSVEQAIRSLSDRSAATLGQSSWFRTAKSEIPAVVGFAGLSDDAAYGEHVWQQLKDIAEKGLASKGLNVGPFMMISQGLGGLVDFGLLPEFEAVRKHFGLSASYGISKGDGFYFEFKQLIWPGGTSE